jgi:DNA-binding NtrC family response regulator
MVGQSARMRNLNRMIDKLGPARWPVLLTGETGTGKEVVARRLHATHPVGSFVTIDCSSMVGPLMESELFGHSKGAFTGAAGQKTGLIELAHGGTAFFDEIGELPLDLQAKLLRVLQEKEYRPVGALTPRKSDFRIIAATNRDLAKEVERGAFRRDLYFRLNVVTIRLSPLRERREDIPALAVHFLERYGRGQRLTPEVLEAMLDYEWPGNVRELENSVQHMVAVNTGPYIHEGDLPSGLANFVRQRRTQGSGGGLEPLGVSTSPTPGGFPAVFPFGSPPSANGSPILSLAEVERHHILKTLEYTRGDRLTASILLGIGRTTLYRKLKEYQIER